MAGGNGWVDVRMIRLAGGGELEVNWLDEDSWEVGVPVSPGANTITLEAIDFSGALIGTEVITVNNTSTVEVPDWPPV